MRPTLLIVDDEDDAREALRRTLHHDFEILEANSAKKAMEILKTHNDVAIVLSDEKMPKKTGTELLTDIKELYPKTLRVILSGQIDLEHMVDAVNRAEVHRFILKPWEDRRLRLQLQEAYLHHQDLHKIAKLQELAVTDPVTNLTNHRYFQERIREETERSHRHSRQYSLTMIDVDNFKNCNDQFGHPMGDHVLKQIGYLLKVATRTADTVSRYGGEEFSIILPETTKAAALEVAERIRKDVQAMPLGSDDNAQPKITLSLGVASYPIDGKTADDIIKCADQALYAAKEAGRNRVEAFK